MPIEEPISLDISEALNSIDTLEQRIRKLFEDNKSSEDPRIQKMVRQLEEALQAIQTVKQQMSDMDFDPNIAEKISETRNQFHALLSDLESARAQLEANQSALRDAYDFTDRMTAMRKEVQETETEIIKLEASIFKMNKSFKYVHDEAGKATLSQNIADTQAELEKATAHLEELNAEYDKMNNNKPNLDALKDAVSAQTEEVDRLHDSLMEASDELDRLEDKQQQQIELIDPESTQILTDAINMIDHRITNIKEETKDAGDEAEKAGEKVKKTSQELTAMQKTVQGIKNIFGGLSTVFNTLGQAATSIGSKMDSVLKNMASKMTSVHKSAAQATMSFGKMATRAIGLMIGVQGVWSILNKLRSTIITNMNYAISGVSALKSAFSSLDSQFTTIKVQLAAAFLPLVEIALPAIQQVVAALSEAVNMVSQLVAALTGAGTWRKAKVTKTAKGGGGSKKSVEQRQQEADEKAAKRNAKLEEQYNAKVTKAYEKAEKEKTRIENRNTKAMEKYEKELKKAEEAVKGYLSPIDEINQYSGSEMPEIEPPELEEFDYDAYLQDLLDGIGDLEKVVADQIEDAGAGAAGVTVEYTDEAISSAIQEIAAKIKEIASQIIAPLEEAWDNVGDFVVKSWKTAMTEVWSLTKKVGSDFLKVWQQKETVKIFEDILKIIGYIGQAIGNLASQFNKAWSENDRGLHILEKIRDIFGIIIGHIKNMAQKTAEWFKSLDFAPLLDSIDKWLASLKPIIDNIWGMIEDFYTQVLLPLGSWAIGEGLPKLFQVFTDLNNKIDWEHLREVLSKFWTHLEPFAEKVGEGLIIFIQDITDSIANFVNSDKFESFLDWIGDWMDRVQPADIAKGIHILVDAILALKGAVIGFGALKGISSIVTTITTAFGGIGSVAKGLTGIFSGLGGAIGKVLGGAGGGVASAASAAGGGGGAGIGGLLKVIAIIGAVILAFGALKQIPGFDWLMQEGITMIGNILSGIAEMVGKIISSVGVGLTSGLPEIADNLSAFGVKLQPFIQSMKGFDSTIIMSVAALSGMVLALTADNIIEKATSWLTGGNSMVQFGEQLCQFGPYLRKFADSIDGINGSAVESAAIAGKALAEMADTVPNSGGFISAIAGNNDLAQFGVNVVVFGRALKQFSDEIQGLDASLIKQAATAGEAMAKMNDAVPNMDGFISYITGDNKLAEFGANLVVFGRALKKFSDEIKGLDANLIKQAATAGEAMAKMNDAVPNTGGVVAFWAGENSLAEFGVNLAIFGKALKTFYNEIKGIDTKLITQVATTSEVLAKLNAMIPNTGGVVAFFAGDNTMDKFGVQLIAFGKCLKMFSDEIKGMDTTLVKNAGIAGQALAEMASALPNVGGIGSIFGGDIDMKEFSLQLPLFGKTLKLFSDNVKGIDTALVSSAAIAGKAIAVMAQEIPNSGGALSALVGDNGMAQFAVQLPIFGKAMKQFSDAVAGIDTGLIQNATIAGKALADMAKELPNSGGFIGDIAGNNDMGAFGVNLVVFGKAMKQFASEVSGLDNGVVQNAVNAGSAISQLAASLPNSGGAIEFLTGGNDMATFAVQLPIFGKAIRRFAEETANLDATAVVRATVAGQALAVLSTSISANSAVNQFMSWMTGGTNISTFAVQLPLLGRAIKMFADEVSGMDAALVTKATVVGQALVALANDVPKTGGLIQFITGSSNLAKFGTQLVVLGKALNEFANEIQGLNTAVISKTVVATSALVELNKELPKTGGLFSFLTGKKDFSSFGKSLVSFGKAMSEFSNSLNGVNLANVPSLIVGIQQLVQMVNTISSVNSEVLSPFAQNVKSFATQLGTLGLEYVNNFLNQFIGASASATAAGTTFIGYIIAVFTASVAQFTQSGATLMQSFGQGMLSKRAEIELIAKGLATTIIQGFSGVSDGLSKAFQGAVDSLKKIWNNFADWMNKHLNIEIDTSKAFGKEIAESLGTSKLNIGKIPRLAQGAVIPPNREFMAVLGDQNRGTNIETPLSTMVEAFNQALSANGGGNGQSITLNLMLPDKRTIAQYAIEGGQVLQMSRGRNPFLLERG